MQTYVLEATRNTGEGVRTYSFESADGVFSKTSLHLPAVLLADRVDVSEAESLCVAHGNYGVLPVMLADEADEADVMMTDPSARACRLAAMNAELNDVSVDVVIDDRMVEEDADAGFYVPRPYDSVAYAWSVLVDLVRGVKDGGLVCFAGEKDTGVNRLVSRLEPYGSVRRIGEEDSAVAYAFTKEDDVDASVDVSTSFTTSWSGESFTFHAADGLFSKDGLDRATRSLGDSVSVGEDDEVLDVACGYGALGTLFAARDGASVTCSDDDIRAARHAVRSLDEKGVDGRVEVCDCATVFDDGVFDVAVCNPPTHAGHGVLEELFADVRRCLVTGGSFYVVVNEGIGVRSLLASSFDTVGVVDRSDGFVVFEAS